MFRILLILCLALPASVLAQVSVSGTLSDKNSGKPIVGAEVAWIEGKRVVFTNQAGAFRIEGVELGRQNLRIQAQDYLTQVQGLKIGSASVNLNFRLIRTTRLSDEVLITSTRASEKTATTYSELDKEAIEKQNFGQDLPFLLNQLPSTVVNSDAGAGVGYTGIRIRGTDPTRTNVTVNGIPLNDAESHGVFWVNMPDFASSVDNIQVQRGVGTSTNGAAAFGASVNIQTTTIEYEPYAEFANSYGSFNTWKNTLNVGTGLINNRYTIDARLSRISSDGWVDRASSNLQSFFISGGYYGEKSLLRVNVFSGQERTYQSWWGIPEAYLDDPVLRRDNYYTYDNEVDNYGQTHYQLHYSFQPSSQWNISAAAHYTQGAGYFEQFREGDDFGDYPTIFNFDSLIVDSIPVRSTNLIRRRWLDNDFYGAIYSANFTPNDKLQFTLGGGWNEYDGDHFGEIIWSQYSGDSDIRDRYYDNRAVKRDFNTYFKATAELTEGLVAYADMQLRQIGYRWGDSTLERAGLDNDQSELFGDSTLLFLNPKVGLTWEPTIGHQIYASYSVANREPTRNDFIDAPDGRTPAHETLRDLEVGYRLKRDRFQASVNGYFMDYDNQLVLSGELNDVGSNVRQNVADSYRAGIELVAAVELAPTLFLAANATFSQNKIRRFEEFVYNYAPFGVEVNEFENTDISFSPNLIAGATLSYRPAKNLDISWLSKYVGQQFLDNTSNPDRALDAFFVNDLRINYTLKPIWAKEIRLGLLVKNILNEQYEPNGYTFSYKIGDDLITENFFYPQAGTNFLLSLALKF